MLFVELRFFFFFALVFALAWLLPKNVQRKTMLTAASYVFYAAWDWRFLALIWFVTATCYLVGLRVGDARDEPEGSRSREDPRRPPHPREGPAISRGVSTRAVADLRAAVRLARVAHLRARRAGGEVVDRADARGAERLARLAAVAAHRVDVEDAVGLRLVAELVAGGGAEERVTRRPRVGRSGVHPHTDRIGRRGAGAHLGLARPARGARGAGAVRGRARRGRATRWAPPRRWRRWRRRSAWRCRATQPYLPSTAAGG